MAVEFEKSFECLLSQYQDAIPSRSRFTGLIKDFFPGQQMQINLLLTAYDTGLVKELEATSNINSTFAFRYVKRLVEEYGISRINADWAVSIWCVCYGKNILHKPCDIKVSSGKSGTSPAIQEEKTGITQYGDLFSYERSSIGNGLAVSGFSGDNKKTIIFQNMYKKQPVVEIKANAFAESEIQEAIMTEGITQISNKAFYGCTKLQQIIFPTSLKEIGDYALAGCNMLTTAALPIFLKQIGMYAFAGTRLKNIDIPKSIYWLGEGAFSECSYIINIRIPENITELPAKIFRGCVNLKKVNLPETLYSIGDFAFQDCGLLESVYVPESVKQIGQDVFDGTHERFVLLCERGSYAELYARKNKLKYQLV